MENSLQGSATSLEKGLLILSHLAGAPHGKGVRELAKDLDMTKSTVHRLLSVLSAQGFVQQDSISERYRMGFKLIEIGLIGLANMSLIEIVPSYLREVVRETGETSFLAVLNDGDVVYLYKAEGTHAVRTGGRLGTRQSMHCTALGKALATGLTDAEVEAILSAKGMKVHTPNTITDPKRYIEHLQLVRSRGYSVDEREVSEDLICIAAPVMDYTGQVVAAISIAGPHERMQQKKAVYSRLIMETAGLISRQLGYVSRANGPQAAAQP